ncbi:hypothetical protein EYF80_054449 [Liparis tanakae]|uniref:Uncharacterized protein n=1 Tax=Liparis tanakae TaxID=230148 RepID=A0A4Z2F3C1_9TELE|nr:hypothetical protein EYF80_054449 [Liparis tanakae]
MSSCPHPPSHEGVVNVPRVGVVSTEQRVTPTRQEVLMSCQRHRVRGQTGTGQLKIIFIIFIIPVLLMLSWKLIPVSHEQQLTNQSQAADAEQYQEQRAGQALHTLLQAAGSFRLMNTQLVRTVNIKNHLNTVRRVREKIRSIPQCIAPEQPDATRTHSHRRHEDTQRPTAEDTQRLTPR